jgi:3-hydroxyisobutyrate dehydrogenase and related beta-hydroxyacid dehydrogenases
MKIGFIGLGVMGLPIATNLLRAGFELVAFDIDQSRIKKLPMQENVLAVASPREVASRVDTIVLMLPNTAQVEEVVYGESGIKEAMSSKSLLIDMSSISPKVTRKMAADLAVYEIDFLDAPVSGGHSGAVNGTLTIMVGGKKEVYDKTQHIFNAVGKRIIYCGEHGAGQTVKVVNQLMSAVNMVGMAEAFTLGVKAGIDPEVMRDVIVAGSGRCWALEDRMPAILEGNFEPGFTIDLHTKDIKLALELSNELNVPIYAGNLVHEIFKTLQIKGKGLKDNSAIITLYEEMAGVHVRKSKTKG